MWLPNYLLAWCLPLILADIYRLLPMVTSGKWGLTHWGLLLTYGPRDYRCHCCSVCIIQTVAEDQGSFCACTQPVRDDNTLWSCLSLARCIHKMIPGRPPWSTGSSVLGPVSISDNTSYHKILWSLEAMGLVVPLIFDRQHCCRGSCQSSEWSDSSEYQSRGFQTQDLMITQLMGYWKRALLIGEIQSKLS